MKSGRSIKILSAIFSIILIFSLSISAYATAPAEAISGAKSGVVRILAEFKDGSVATGSGFGVGAGDEEPRFFVTNAHVVMDTETGEFAENVYILLDDNAATVEVKFYSNGDYVEVLTDFDDDKVIECDIVNRNSVKAYPDVAIIKAEKPVPGRKTLPLMGTSEDLLAAQPVYALGYPGSTDYLTLKKDYSYNLVADIEDVTVTNGIVSMLTNSALFDDTDIIMHSATVNHGNSGGPLLTENGAVAGINTYILASDSDQYASIYIDYAKEMLDNEGIGYTVYGEAPDNTPLKTALWAAIGAIAIVAAVLVIIFSSSAKRYTNRVKEEKEAEEAAHALRVQGTAGAFDGRRFEIISEISFGRAPDNAVVYPTDTKGVSSHHCVIIRNGDQLYLKDLGSSFGTFLNGTQKLTPNQLVTVKVGDRISLGSELETFIITRKGGTVA